MGPLSVVSVHIRSNSTKYPASGTDNVSDLKQMLQSGRVHKFMHVSAIRVLAVVLVCLCSNCCHVTAIGGPRGL